MAPLSVVSAVTPSASANPGTTPAMTACNSSPVACATSRGT
jgi:hypothetical protein